MTTHRWLVALPLLLCGVDCGDGDSGDAAATELSGAVVAPAGTATEDYQVFAIGISQTATPVSAAGEFKATSETDRTGMLMAVPREGTTTATTLGGGKGVVLSPIFGDTFLSRDREGRLSLTSGVAATVDSTTTILAALLFHPMLANPNPAASKELGAWLVEKANRGWSELEVAHIAFELAPDLDDPSFLAAMSALVESVVETLPADLVLSRSSKVMVMPSAQPTTETAKQGAICMSVTIDDPKTPSIAIDNSAGTNLDYLCVVRASAEADFPDGADSPAFTTPNRLMSVPPGTPIRSTFIAAKSYASYLDIVGNSIGLVTNLIGGATIGPNKAIPLPLDRVTEVRCLSGGYGSAADTQVADFITANLAADARSAFVHNVTAATIEIMSAIPGADTAMKSEVGKEVLKKVVQQAVIEVEAKANSQGKQLGASDIYEVIYNVARAGLNELVDKSADEWKKGQLEKLAAFVKWGGKSLVKFINVSGKVANAGAAGTRAYALARPQSLMEYFLVATESEEKDAGAGPDSAVPDNSNYDKEGLENSFKACRKMLDLGCVQDQFGCPTQIPPSQKDHPYHDCMIAGQNCILAASSCDEVFACDYSTSQWPEDLAAACD